MSSVASFHAHQHEFYAIACKIQVFQGVNQDFLFSCTPQTWFYFQIFFLSFASSKATPHSMRKKIYPTGTSTKPVFTYSGLKVKHRWWHLQGCFQTLTNMNWYNCQRAQLHTFLLSISQAMISNYKITLWIIFHSWIRVLLTAVRSFHRNEIHFQRLNMKAKKQRLYNIIILYKMPCTSLKLRAL